MTKQSGIGGLFFVNGYDLSGDVGVINAIHDTQNLLDVTGLNKGAPERIGGLGDGNIDFTSFFNDGAGASHTILKVMGGGDKRVTYAVNSTLGRGGWSLTGKQADYSGTRGADGSLAFQSSFQSSDGEGLRGGVMLTAGKRTDTTATNGSSVNGQAASNFGADLFLHVFSFSGTDVTVTIQDSANNSAWSNLTGAVFTAITAGPTSERIALANDAVVRKYLRAITTTTGGFSSLVFAVMACRRYA